MIVIVPACISLIINFLVYSHARSSTQRIQPQSITSQLHNETTQQPKVSRRDLNLFRQMLIMFFLFAGGWTPIYLTLVVNEFIAVPSLATSILSLMATICLLTDIIAMIVRDRELREYLRERIR
ncbi:unnamed protein product [Rotaria magnacalcarata]|uniref:G-protein coupled receptors family 1 profile domain-containing protein n=2 Tax=Rotaria magnacalcarata TaxID=392030 RepID=A0A816YFZ5_9BILA|nr:unnamed protein product [Rotaria magnacalcarata]